MLEDRKNKNFLADNTKHRIKLNTSRLIMSIREIQVAGNKLSINQLDNIYDSATGGVLTGSWVWDSAMILSDYISTDVNLQGKSVIELGAGAGLPGMTAALLGAIQVVLTDISLLLPQLQKNVELNGLKDRVEVREMVWGMDELPSDENKLGEFDLVLMSDVLYDVAEMDGLAKSLKKVCGKETIILAANEVRLSTGDCSIKLASYGFEIVELLSCLGSSMATSEDDAEFAVYRLIPPQ